MPNSKSKNYNPRIDFFLAVLIFLLAVSCLKSDKDFPNLLRAKDTAKEAYVKQYVHDIQVAVERYKVDHGEYPKYLIGGDHRGWDPVKGCAVLTTVSDENLRPPRDPLIDGGYLADYPDNAFIEPGEGLTSIIAWTSGTMDAGKGDVRFGLDGEFMGNCMDDSRYLFDSYGNPTRLQYTMLRNDKAFLGVLQPDSPNPFYAQGGIYQWDTNNPGKSNTAGEEIIKAFWPGQFFYRSGGDFGISDPSSIFPEGREYIWAWPYVKIDKYILGGFGSPRTWGLDVIRLTDITGQAASTMDGAINGALTDAFYQDHSNPDRLASHPDFDIRVHFSSPEVMGGGEKGLMPQFPYYESGTGAWLFGAPDGIPDGVVIVYTSESEEPLMELEYGPIDDMVYKRGQYAEPEIGH